MASSIPSVCIGHVIAAQVLMTLAFISGLFGCTIAIISLLKWRNYMLIAAVSCFASQGNRGIYDIGIV